MDILQIFNEKFKELGEEKVCGVLELPKHIIRQFTTGKKTPSYKTCQRIVDLWGNGHSKEADKELKDGSIAAFEYDKDGVLNASFCPAEWGQKKAAWDGRDVCLCLPVIDHFPQQTVYCLLALVMRYRMAICMDLRGDDSMITRSRNHLAKRFLNSGASWSIWFDSDMVFPIGHAGVYSTMTNMRNVPEKFLGLHTIERLISRGRTVVGGLYWDRRGGGRLIAGGGPALLSPIPSDTLHPVNFCGTGCLAVHRKVFLDIAAKFPETLNESAPGNECGFFTNIQTPDGRMMGEDESFCKRATDAGHPTFLDLGLLCGHIGSGNIHAMPASGSKI